MAEGLPVTDQDLEPLLVLFNRTRRPIGCTNTVFPDPGSLSHLGGVRVSGYPGCLEQFY